MKKLLLLVLVLIGFKVSFGQVSISMHNTDYNTDFNAWNGSLPTGFAHSGSGSTFRGTSAPDTQGGTYAVSNSGYGYQPSGTSSSLTLTGTFTNTTGSTITELEVSYEAFNIYTRASRLPSWSVSSSLGTVSSLTWDYNSSASAGSPDLKTVTLTGLNIANNATFTFTFSSDRGSGSGSSPKIGLNNIKVRSISAPPCSISASGLANLTCNDNGTSQTVADDFLTFDLDPTGASIGSSYSVSVSGGTITPTTASYGSSTTFTLNNGSAGGGNVTVTITDAGSGTCTFPVNIVDPGVCSVPCTPTTGADTQTACDSYTWVENNNTVYTASGVYTATLQTVAGCDSVVTLDLTINNSSTGSETVAACDSYTWSANNTTYTASGVYTATLTNAANCDSIVTLDLTINNSSTGSETIAACDSYTWSANNTTYTASGVYTATLTNAANCDSIATLNLTINTPTTGTDTQTACDSYTWVENNNTVYTATGVYTATLQTAAGCDSVVTLDLTINNSSAGSETVAACDSYTWSANNTTYTASGVYTATLTNAANCDSIATLNLTINTPTTGTDTQTACDSYTWVGNNNTVYTTSGVYTATLQTAAGCDSVVTLDLTINNSSTGSETVAACDSYTWSANNTTYTASGVYTVTLTNAANCDSIATLNLTINTPTTGTDTQTACDSYTWSANNTTYTASGVYTATLTNAANCDSIVTLDLTINNSSTGSETVAACDSYTWSANNTTYTASGVYTVTLTNAANCDSIATLNLTINTPTTGTDTQTACDSYTWVENNNTVYTTSGVYTATLQTAAGCDSVVTLDLTINNSSTGSETVAACDSYTWSANNTTYTASGVYTATLTNAANCDSIVTLDLTINNSSTGSETVAACDSYTWSANNTTYTTSGVYTATLANAANCDSIATLNLTINTPTTGTDVQSACGSYTWVENNNTVYTATGVYTATLQTVAGCDSVVTLNLTINTPTTGTDVQTACDSFDWIDGNTYTASNNTATFTIAGGAANGCDSLVTLDLTINTVDVSVTPNDPSITANAVNATYQWIDCSNNSDIAGETNATFTATANGSYAVKVTENGCTSTSSCVSIVTVGLEENIFNDVKIYPNPNNGQFTISFGEVVNPTVSIYTVDSKLVYLQEEVNDKNVSIELLDEPGVYFITISKGAYNYSTRVVVQ